jgi:hypothetical protein
MVFLLAVALRTRIVLDTAFDPTLQKPIDTLTADIQKVILLGILVGTGVVGYKAYRQKQVAIIPAFLLVVAFVGLIAWGGQGVVTSFGDGARAFIGIK